MSQIPVVQGVAVPSNGQYNPQPAHQGHQGSTGYVEAPTGSNFGMAPTSDFNGVKGAPQPKQYQDVFFAILFVGHLVVMMFVMAGLTTFSNSNGYSYGGVVWCVSMCALVAVGLSTAALGFMMQNTTLLVKAALFFSVGMSLVVGVMGAMAGSAWMAIFGFAAFLIGCCYAYFVWGRIPVRQFE